MLPGEQAEELAPGQELEHHVEARLVLEGGDEPREERVVGLLLRVRVGARVGVGVGVRVGVRVRVGVGVGVRHRVRVGVRVRIR